MADPARLVSSRRLLPFPGTPKRHTSNLLEADMESLNSDAVKSYLLFHPEMVEEHVLDFVDITVISSWMDKKRLPSSAAGPNKTLQRPSVQKRYNTSDLVSIQQNLLKQIMSNTDLLPMINELCHAIGSGIGANVCTLYTLTAGGKELCVYTPPIKPGGQYTLRGFGPVGRGSIVAAHVAATHEAVLVHDLLSDERFPRGVGTGDYAAASVVCLPQFLPTGDLMCIMEFVCREGNKTFTDYDYQAAVAQLTWTGMTLYQCQLNKTLTKQADLNEFLLEVSKIIFDDIIAMDHLVEKIMIFTKNLVQADRCTLFLVDYERGELYANLFDEGVVRDGKPVLSRKSEVRFPLSRGIAGHVAMTAEVVNIPDAYADPRFNREIDRLTGYTTRTLLAMPIISNGEVIGVVQMINKAPGNQGVCCFTKTDESSFKMFAVYCAIALHYSKIYRLIQLRTAHYKVAMEQLSYHAQASREDVKQLRDKHLLKPEKIPADFDTFYYYVEPAHKPILPQLFIYMLHDLFGPDAFDVNKLCGLVLTVQKNYRSVPYHNWKHGFIVAHAIYVLLKKIDRNAILSPLRQQALMIACLCHDIDHRGYNNQFLKRCQQPLAVLYETSTMEEHHYVLTVQILQIALLYETSTMEEHYVLTVQILQQDEHNIFSGLSGEEYGHVLHYIHQAIIATDLSTHLSKHKALNKTVLTQSFDLKNPQHFEDTLGLLMTAADLLVSCKSWPIQKDIVKLMYEEFFKQGDEEKLLGIQPLPMMDRDNEANMALNQVGFVRVVCLPCYQTLASIFPEYKPLYDTCKENLDQWERVVEGKCISCWEPDKSRT